MKLLATYQLKEGMRLSRDVIDVKGTTILSKDAVISTAIKERLMRRNIDYVYVSMDAPTYSAPDKPVLCPADRRQVYEEMVDTFTHVFADPYAPINEHVEKLQLQNQQLISSVISEKNVLKTLESLKSAQEYTVKHSINVSILSAMLAKWLMLDDKIIREVALGGLLHDLGKARIPRIILDKPARLSDGEYEIIKKHPTFAYQMLKEFNLPKSVIQGVLFHHERYDGTGYISGAIGSRIPLYARIIAIVDVFDAIASNRVYQARKSYFKAVQILKDESFSSLDPYITEVFIKNLSDFLIGNQVVLSDGEIGEVVYLNKSLLHRPMVRVAQQYIDLSECYHLEIMDVVEEAT